MIGLVVDQRLGRGAIKIYYFTAVNVSVYYRKQSWFGERNGDESRSTDRQLRRLRVDRYSFWMRKRRRKWMDSSSRWIAWQHRELRLMLISQRAGWVLQSLSSFVCCTEIQLLSRDRGFNSLEGGKTLQCLCTVDLDYTLFRKAITQLSLYADAKKLKSLMVH